MAHAAEAVINGEIRIDRGGFSLGAPDTPRAGAPWLMLANSLGATRAMWRPQHARLAAHYAIVGYHARGHGGSDAPPGPYGMDDLVNDAIAVMDQLSIRTTHFTGLSLGGMTELGLAIRHPARLDALVCCDARADCPPAAAAIWHGRVAAAEAGGLEAIAEETLAGGFTPAFRAREPDAVRRWRAMVLQTSMVGYRGAAHAVTTCDWCEGLPSINVPTLYVCGAQDQGSPPAAMRAMTAATPGAVSAEVEDAAHLPNIYNAPAFEAAIAPFLKLA